MASDDQNDGSQRDTSGKVPAFNPTLVKIGFAFVVAAIGFAIWAFSLESLESHQWYILNWLFSLAAGIGAGAFTGSFSIKSDKLIPGVTLSAASGFAVWFLCFWFLFPVPDPALPKIMLMDSTLPEVVYDPETRANGGSNTDNITEILDDLQVQLNAERTSLRWRREEQVKTIAPHLIVIHLSCFYDRTNVLDSDRKFRSFLEYMKDTKTKFLIYTRGPHAAVTPQLKKRWERQQAFLKDVLPPERVSLFIVEGGAKAKFRDPKTGRELKLRVKSMLGID